VIVRLVAGPDSAVVDPDAGGRLASLVAGGRERLIDRVQPGSRFPAISWGSFLMAPWVGRIRGGRVDWQGRSYQLAANDANNAIHGACFEVPWQVEAASPAAVELRLAIDPARWPPGGIVRQRISLRPGSLECAASIEATEPMPAALGWHPWFLRGPDEDLDLTVRADRRLVLDEEMIPAGTSVAVEGSFDLRSGPTLGDRRLDDVFIGARSPAIVAWPDLELRVAFSQPVHSVVVFSPPGSVCVEPATAWPDALRLSATGVEGTGQVFLEAGEELAATMSWSW
jgi:aldose 1-epimerase